MRVTSLISYIVKWLDGYCEKFRINGFVIGLSGGIDSAVTSSLCALTGRKTIVVSLPILDFKKNLQNVLLHINWLEKFKNVELKNVRLTEMVKNFEFFVFDNISNDLVMANFYSRIRMVILYSLANSCGNVVVGTGNKIEDFGVGFFTKYGDGGVDVSPIADLTKSQVYIIGKKIGIVNEIMMAKPSDGLWPDNRCDESQIGSSYGELEWAIDFYESNKKKTGNIFFSFLEAKTNKILNIYVKLRKRNSHKIKDVPICSLHDLSS